MRRTSWLPVSLLATFVLTGSSAGALAADTTVKIGDRIGNITFKDIHYLPRSLADFPDARAFVLVFTNTTCPVVQRYLPVLRDMEKEHRSKGVQFVAINEGENDGIRAIATQAVRHEMELPFVKDIDGNCAVAVGVRRVPEVVVLDAKRHIRYRGRIDDQYRLGGARSAPTRRDLVEAIDAVLSGKAVAVPEVPVDGCLIARPELAPVRESVTFGKHVAPILRKHCTECHRPGTTAPFSLITYEQARAQAEEIAEVAEDGRMPPWYASDDFGHFINRRGLSAEEKQTLVAWAHSGKERGDTTKLPPPKVENGWRIGKPDLVLKAPEHSIPASGTIPYKYVVLSHIFLRDTWMRGIQILPDNPRVVHHCNMAYLLPGDSPSKAHFITGTVPGGAAMTLDSGVGFRIPRGSVLILQIHYVTTGKEEKCRIAVGFQYASGRIDQLLRHELLVDYKFKVPPGAPAHPVSASRVLDRDAIGLALFVHMHLRGRDMTFRAVRPDGTSETLLMVPNYSFDWQMPYRWEPGKVRFPKGTRLECLAHYDNSTFNPYNPDPRATVKDGQQTTDEMLNGYVFYTDANERLGLEIDPRTGGVRESAAADEPIFEPGAELKVEARGGAGGEGPAWHPKLGLLSSGNGQIYQLDREGKSHIYRKGAGTNGLLFDHEGRLLACDCEGRRMVRIELDGKLSVLTDRYEEKRYNTPNDLTLDSKGRLYFSDPRYGDRTGMEIFDSKKRPIEGVYRIDPDGSVTRAIGRELERPNGVLVSADDRSLYVADNNNNALGGARKLWRFELRKDGSVDVASGKVLYDWGTGRGPDGLKQDQKGKLYVAAGLNKPNPPFELDKDNKGGIYVLSPDGKLLAFLPVPTDEVTNCAFGGDDLKTLYITGGGTLYSIRTITPGRVVWPTGK
jgi:sugar lactone lactonase YvrE